MSIFQSFYNFMVSAKDFISTTPVVYIFYTALLCFVISLFLQIVKG